MRNRNKKSLATKKTRRGQRLFVPGGSELLFRLLEAMMDVYQISYLAHVLKPKPGKGSTVRKKAATNRYQWRVKSSKVVSQGVRSSGGCQHGRPQATLSTRRRWRVVNSVKRGKVWGQRWISTTTGAPRCGPLSACKVWTGYWDREGVIFK